MARVLTKLPVGYQWCMENDDDKSVKILGSIRKARKQPHLSLYTRVALALTEACCERGEGRVYVIFNDPPRPGKSSDDVNEFDLYDTLIPIPGLFYVPETWTDQCQAEWRLLSPSEQLDRCWAPLGWVHSEMTVLPFAAVVHDDSGAILSRPVYHAGLASTVIMFITGASIYVCPSDEMSTKCDIEQSEGRLYLREYRSRQDDWSAFSEWECIGMQATLSMLEQLSQTREDLLTQYGLLINRVQAVHSRTVELAMKLEASRIQKHLDKESTAQRLRDESRRFLEEQIRKE